MSESLPLMDAAASGDRLSALLSLRDLLASTIADAEQARDVASLSRQFTDVLDRIAELQGAVAGSVPVVGDPVDELLAFRLRKAAQ